MFFDSHAHLDDTRFDNDRDLLIPQIHASGVDLILNAASDIESSKKAINLADKYDFIYASVGVHPHDAKNMTDEGIAKIKGLAQNKKVVAIGEIGLDYYYNHSDHDTQKKWFSRQLDLADSLNLPVIIHDRDAHGDCMDILKNSNISKFGGVMHCYSGSIEMVKIILNMGMYISFAGPVTFKNAAKITEVAKYAPTDRILIETDCPYLAPEPFRGKRNHSGYVKYIAERLAQIKGLDIEKIAKATKTNAKNLFKIKL